MNERDKIYREILQRGILSIRAAAWSGHVRYCGIEADHLHNIPALLGETNEALHDYYFDAERTSYMLQIELLSSESSTEFNFRQYNELWDRLAELRKRSQ